MLNTNVKCNIPGKCPSQAGYNFGLLNRSGKLHCNWKYIVEEIQQNNLLNLFKLLCPTQN